MRLRSLLRSVLITLFSPLFRLMIFAAPRPESIRLEEVTVQIPDLPPHLEGFTIGVLSDLHIGPIVPPALVRRAAEIVAQLQPDLTVMAGDLISKSEAAVQADHLLASVAGAPGVRGNWDWKRRKALAQQRVIRFLVNEGFEAAPGLWLAGVDDTLLGQPDVPRALEGAPEGAIRILLAHEPDYADQIQPHHRIALQISGHSHGGQVRLPFLGATLLPPKGRKYSAGLCQAPHCQVYTSRGIGMAHIPIRWNCPPEVTLIRLTRA